MSTFYWILAAWALLSFAASILIGAYLRQRRRRDELLRELYRDARMPWPHGEPPPGPVARPPGK